MFSLEKSIIEIFVIFVMFNLYKYIENDIFYDFKLVLFVNFIEKKMIFEKVRTDKYF